ncbi:hypothetical protein [Alteromonas sp. BMJM2]|uniref:hypothetical protein n=1 Tax=Alteromonas sp. BMJM2 TaxID=2954241 RepID=UPI0022B4D83F|nr:hypothetical protein [Alteromonas sp. BMJM2]
MKIVFEEKDINEILTAHVKGNNLLGLADKDFSVELEINGDQVSANLDTDVDSLVGGTTASEPKPVKRRRKAAKKAEPEPEKSESADEPAAEEKTVTPLSKKVTAEEPADEEPAEEAPEEKDDKPPFKTEEEEESKVDTKPRKSLFQ